MSDVGVDNRNFQDFPFSGKYSISSGIVSGTTVTLSGIFDPEGNFRTTFGFPGIPWNANDAKIGDVIVDTVGQRYRVLGYDGTNSSPLGTSFSATAENLDNATFVSSGGGAIYRGSQKHGFSLDHVFSTGGMSEQLQQSLRSRFILELDEFLCRVENIANVQPKPSANGQVLVYQGTNWVPTTLSFGGSSVVITESPITGNGSMADPVRIENGNAKSQHLRYNGTNWNIRNSAFDAIIASTGGDFTNVNDAINSGCRRLAVITNTTQTALATLSQDTSIKLFHGATMNNSPALASAFNCNGNNLSIDGNGTINWTADATAASSYSTDAASTLFKMNGVAFIMNNQNNKTISNQNQKYTDVEITLPASSDSGFLVSANRNAQLTNVNFLGGGAGASGIIRNLGNLEASNTFVNSIGNGTTNVIELEGNTNMVNARINQSSGTAVINGNAGSGNVHINSLIASGAGDVNVIMNNTGQFSLLNSSGLNDITMTSNRCKMTHCDGINSITVNGNSAKISHYDGGAITVNGNNAHISFADLSSGSITGTTNDTFIAHSTVGALSLTGDRNKISECAASSISVNGNQNIINGNRSAATITLVSGSNNNIIGHNLTDTAIITTGTIGTVQSGNTQY